MPVSFRCEKLNVSTDCVLFLFYPSGKCGSCSPDRGRESSSRRAADAETRADSGGRTGDLERHHPDPVQTHTMSPTPFVSYTSLLLIHNTRVEDVGFSCVTHVCVQPAEDSGSCVS